jgi:hypothetical protein
VLSEKELNSLNLTIDELKLIKPYYTTDELDRYYKSKKNKYFIIYTDSTFKNPMTIRPYKNLKNHLDKFVDIITSDNKPYGLHRSRDENFFNNEKIISLRKCSNRPIFTYVDEPSYVSATFFVIKTKRINMKYLTVILNSRLIMFWLRYRGQMQGNNYQVDKNPLLSLPIYYLKEKELTFLNIMQLLKPVVQASNYIFESIPNSHISEAFEEVIDALVFELYFPEEFAEKGIEIEKYAQDIFKPIDNLSEEEQIKAIQEAYQTLREKNNPLRNQIKLMKIELKELLLPILSV